MTAFGAAGHVPHKDVTQIQRCLLKASTQIWKGGLVAFDANGLLVPCTPTTGTQFAGVALESVLSASTGSYYCEVARDGRHMVVSSSITQANVGDIVYATDDQTIGSSTQFAHKVGVIAEVEDATHTWVDISDGTSNPALHS
jgi:hypothetical protein